MILLVVPGPFIVVTASGVRGKRDGLGISRAELAAMTGIAVDTLWEIEGGMMPLQPDQRVALMRALGAEFDELFTVSARR
jgi:transcriptional regulator with XRE-family HTH domain